MPDTKLSQAVADTVKHLAKTDQDNAAVQLAKQYAEAIDNADDHTKVLADLGPKLLATLDALGATPAARARVTKETSTGQATNLGKLRAARRTA